MPDRYENTPPPPPPPAPPAPPPAPGSGTPLQPAYAKTTLGTPTFANDPWATDPRYAVQSILRGFAPQAATATGNLNDTLASMGISGGGAVDAQGALQSQLAGALAPALGSAYSQYAGNSLAQTLQNAAAANTMTGMNVANTNRTGEFNASSYNSMQALLAQLLEEQYQTQAGATTSLYGQGLAGETNLNEGYLSGGSGLAGQTGQNFPVYQPPPWSQFGSGLASALWPGTPSPQYNPYAPTAPSGTPSGP